MRSLIVVAWFAGILSAQTSINGVPSQNLAGSNTANTAARGNCADYISTAITVGGVPNCFFVDSFGGAVSGSLKLAVDAANAAGGGMVFATTPGTYQIPVTLAIGTASAHTHLFLSSKVVPQCSMTDGTDCIVVQDASGLHGFGGVSAGPITANGGNADIQLTSNAVVQNVIRNAAGDGSQQSVSLDGFTVVNNATATVYQALIHLRGLFSSTVLRNLYLSSCYAANSGSGICMLIDSPGGETTDVAGALPFVPTSVTGVVGQTTATVTVAAGVDGTLIPGPDGHGIWPGDKIVVHNCSDTTYNSTFAAPATVLSVTDNTHFTYTTTSTIGTSTAPTGCSYNQKVVQNITSVFHIDNLVISGGQTGSRPLVIESVQNNSLGDIWCHSCDIEGPGAGQATIEINGNTGNLAIQEVAFYGLRIEGRSDVNAGTIGLKIADASNINVYDIACGNEAGTAGQSCIDISQTGSQRTYNINIFGIVDQGWANVVNNHITSQVLASSGSGINASKDWGAYHYAGTNFDGTIAGRDTGLAIDSLGFTSDGSTSGLATIKSPAVQGTPTLTLPTATGTLASIGSSATNQATGGAAYLLNLQGAASAVVGTASAVTLYSYTIPANTIPATGCAAWDVMVNHSTGTASVTYVMNVAGSSNTISSAGTGEFVLHYKLCNTGSTAGGTQVFLRDMGVFGTSGISTGVFNSAQNIASTSTIALTFTFNVASTDQVTPHFFEAMLQQ